MKKWFLLSSLAVLPLAGARAEWSPVKAPLTTEWGRALKPDGVWAEYPRPQLQREGWTNLNGLWDCAVVGKDDTAQQAWPDKSGGPDNTGQNGVAQEPGAVVPQVLQILVPFCLEAPLSGVGRRLEPDQALWYRRDLPAKPEAGKRTLLHFGAVDYDATVWVNGKEVGRHVGGHTPFSFDITGALAESGNVLSVKVLDATEGHQLHGKQSLRPRAIWFERASGIWQTVWLEQVPERSIRDLDFQTVVAAAGEEGGEMKTSLQLKAGLEGTPVKGETLRVKALLEGKEVSSVQGPADQLSIPIPEPRWWTPDTPTLYDIKLELVDATGKVIDAVTSYSALRQVGKQRDENGNLHITLNGKPVFLYGTLDQGWWPDGLVTPPSEEAMIYDLKFLKAAGFNMVRKHVKVENSRYYYHCDRLGLAVWQDQVSCSLGSYSVEAGLAPRWTRLAPNPVDAIWPAEAHAQWVKEYKSMVDHLRDHPSVVIWCPFNEAWGQHQSMEIGKMAKEYDPTRLVCLASGGNFWPEGDIASEHHYPEPTFPLGDQRFKDYIKVIGEMGGHGWAVPGHVFTSGKAWGYGGLPGSLEEWKIRYERSVKQLVNLRHRGVSAAVYTETADTWNEVNGLLTYDRLPKADTAWFRQVNDEMMKSQENLPGRSTRQNSSDPEITR